MTLPRNGCSSGKTDLLLFLDDELTIDQRLAFEDHVERCDSCREALHFHLEVERILHLDAGLEPDGGFEARILAQLQRSTEVSSGEAPATMRDVAIDAPPHRGFPARGVMWRSLAAAALVLFGLRLGSSWRSETSRSDRGEPDRGEGHVSLGAVPPSRGDSPQEPDVTTAPVDHLTADPRVTTDSDHEIEPARLAMAQQVVGDALLASYRGSSGSPAFAATFSAQTAALSKDRWPIENLMMGAIDAEDPILARAAVEGAVVFGLKNALPAIRRAQRRDETRESALIALGALGDTSSLASLGRALDDPRLAAAAIEGLRRFGGDAASRLLAPKLDHPLLGDQIRATLASMGTAGVRTLLLRSHAGDLDCRAALRAAPEVADAIAQLMSANPSPEVLEAAIPLAAHCGSTGRHALGALLGNPTWRDKAIDALVAATSVDALGELIDAVERHDLTAEEGTAAIDEGLDLLIDQAFAIQELVKHRGAEALLVEALNSDDPSDVNAMSIVVADASLRPSFRSSAAEQLANYDRLDSHVAMRLATEFLLIDERAAASLLICAARGGATIESGSQLGPISHSATRNLMKRAISIANRWRSERTPPYPHERKKLEKMIRSAIPQL